MRVLATSVYIVTCSHNNVIANNDVTMDITSNVINWCDVIMGHGTKT